VSTKPGAVPFVVQVNPLRVSTGGQPTELPLPKKGRGAAKPKKPSKHRFRAAARWTVYEALARIGTAALVAGVVVFAVTVTVPTTLPTAALGSSSIWKAETALILFIVGLVVLSTAYYGIVLGVLPTKFGKEGFEYTLI
jgi:hypothetical protein